jgi:hypothetical protein
MRSRWVVSMMLDLDLPLPEEVAGILDGQL